MNNDRAVIIGIVIVLVVWPLALGDYAVSQGIRAMIYALMALSFSILAGRLGWFSLCQTTFAGISAYVIAILGVEHGWPAGAVIPTAILVAVAFAVVFGLLTLRSRAVSFLMLTLALGQMVWALSFQWVDVTGGYNGISGIRPPAVLGIDLNADRVFFAVLAVVTLLIFLGVRLMYRSGFGLLLLGIQENEERMRALGHPVYLARFTAFVLAAAIAAVGGIFLVFDMGIMSPSPLGLGHAVWVLTAAVLGGYRTLWGPALGVVILVGLESVASQFTDRHDMVIGLVLLLCILLMPRGLAEVFGQYRSRSAKSVTTSS